MCRLTEVRFINEPFERGHVGDEMEYRLLTQLLGPGGNPARRPPAGNYDGPVLFGIPGVDFVPTRPDIRGTRNVGYAFFELDLLVNKAVDNARRFFDTVIGGSTWCADVMRAAN